MYEIFKSVNNLIAVVVLLIAAAPMIFTPNKLTERPKCRIKSPVTMRVMGIIIVLWVTFFLFRLNAANIF